MHTPTPSTVLAARTKRQAAEFQASRERQELADKHLETHTRLAWRTSSVSR